MSGLEITTYDFDEIAVDGRLLKVTGLRVRDYAAAAARIKEGEWKTAKEAAQAILAMTLVPGDREVILKRAYIDEKSGNPVEIGDVARWFRTPTGKLYEWYMRLRKYQPDLTEDAIDEMFGTVVIGMAVSDAEANPTETGPTKAEGSTGTESSATSPPNTDGPPPKSQT